MPLEDLPADRRRAEPCTTVVHVRSPRKGHGATQAVNWPGLTL
jgi:hypothetical protein